MKRAMDEDPAIADGPDPDGPDPDGLGPDRLAPDGLAPDRLAPDRLGLGWLDPDGLAPDWLAPDLRRLRAANPSPMTGTGTNSYLLGQGDVVLIDPGPDLPVHHRALLSCLQPGERIVAILVTHAHADHCGGAAAMSRATAAPVLGFGAAGSGRSATMQRLAAEGLTGGGEGLDHQYRPDRCLRDGEVLHLNNVTLEVLHSPGHTGCHLCFASGDRLFCGDHVMGWSTSLISPPEGDMAQYRGSLLRLAARNWAVLLPGHGAPIGDPAARLAFLIRHRADREAEILAALAQGPLTADALTRRIYPGIAATLFQAARRNVLAHLIEVTDRGLATARSSPLAEAHFHRIRGLRP